MKKLIASLAVFAVASSAWSADLGKRGKKDYMGVCRSTDFGSIYVVTNASDSGSCDPMQAVGTAASYCTCVSDGNGGYTWSLLSSELGTDVDLSAYVLLAGKGNVGQTIQGRTGSNRARVELGITSTDAMLFGSGAEPGSCGASGTSASCSSGDVGSYLSLSNSGGGELTLGSKSIASVGDIFQFSNMAANGEIKLQAASYIRLHGGEDTLVLSPSKLVLSNTGGVLESPSESNFITVGDSNVSAVVEDGAANTQLTMAFSSGLSVSSTSDGTAENSSSLSVSPTQVEAFVADGASHLVLDAAGLTFSGNGFGFTVTPPTTSSDTCTAGMVAWDANFWYVCIATDTWKRSALSTW